MMLISRLLTANSGTVTIDKMNILSTPTAILAQRLAILRQDNHTSVRFTVSDLVAFGRYPHSKGRITQDDQKNIERALKYLDITSLRDRFLDEFSGGQPPLKCKARKLNKNVVTLNSLLLISEHKILLLYVLHGRVTYLTHNNELPVIIEDFMVFFILYDLN